MPPPPHPSTSNDASRRGYAAADALGSRRGGFPGSPEAEAILGTPLRVIPRSSSP